MKRKLMAALVAFFVFATPVAVFAQDDAPVDDAPVVVQVDEAPAGFDWTDLLAVGVWLSAIVTVWSVWSFNVSKVLVDKGIKAFIKPLLAQFSGSDEASKAIRTLIIHGAVAVAAYFTVGVFNYNIFTNAPEIILMQIPNATLQSMLTAGWLAAGAFLLHSGSKWLSPDTSEIPT